MSALESNRPPQGKAQINWICRIIGFALRNQQRGHRWEKWRYGWYRCTRRNCKSYWLKDRPQWELWWELYGKKIEEGMKDAVKKGN